MKWLCQDTKKFHVKSLWKEPLCLPNSHIKTGLEVPSPFVAATQGTIVPMFSAPSLNCGMGIIISSLMKKDVDGNFFEQFSHLMRREVSPRFSKIKTALLWLNIVKRPHLKYDLQPQELENVFRHGASALIEKYGLPPETLEHIEHRGSLFNESEKKEINFSGLIPRSCYTNGLHDMGFNFGGNHFLETHFVEEIVDNEVAKQWGITKNQVLFFYHGGGGHATYHLGRYFARRRKNTVLERFFLFFLKALLHFGSLKGLRHFKERWRYYFSRVQFPEIPLDTEEGKRLLQSIKAGLNYGYAFRLALFARVRDALNDILTPPPNLSLLYDAAHNSIFKERHGDKELIIHRQDAMVARKEIPVFIAGFNNTRSYLGIGTGSIGSSFGSVSASAAVTIKRHQENKKAVELNPEQQTIIYRHKQPFVKTTKHITDDGLFEVAREFESDGIIKPVAYIRPMAVIKGPR